MSAEVRVSVPPSIQQTDYTCGPACMRSVLGFYGLDLTEERLAKELKATPEAGTLPRDMVSVARSYGFRAVARMGMGFKRLRAELLSGRPVILAIQAWADRPRPDYKGTDDNGHYVVAVGYDRHGVRILDPVTGSESRMSWRRIRQRWHDRDGEDERYEQLGIVVKLRR